MLTVDLNDEELEVLEGRLDSVIMNILQDHSSLVGRKQSYQSETFLSFFCLNNNEQRDKHEQRPTVERGDRK